MFTHFTGKDTEAESVISGFFDGGGPHPQSTPAIVNRASAAARVVIAAWRA